MFLLAGFVGCGGGGGPGGGSIGSHEDAADRVAGALREAEGIVEGIQDKASAAAAKPKLEALARRLEEITAAVERLGPPGDEPYRKTDAKMREALSSFGKKTMALFERTLDSREIAQALGDGLASLQGKLPKLRGMLGG